MLIYKDSRKLLLQYIAIFIGTWQILFKNVAQGVQSLSVKKPWLLKTNKHRPPFGYSNSFPFHLWSRFHQQHHKSHIWCHQVFSWLSFQSNRNHYREGQQHTPATQILSEKHQILQLNWARSYIVRNKIFKGNL